MKIVYIAGPFRAANQWLQELNIRNAEHSALEVWNLGFAAICPHLNTAHFQGAAPDGTWLAGDIAILKRCDALLMTADWRKSAGAIAEHEIATQAGIPTYESIRDLVEGESGGEDLGENFD